ncbi:MAG: ornithine cyclodeaminase family protein [Arenicella sp.]|nr:ornithine cyclodeaminase family protein [Arenicella sp.]
MLPTILNESAVAKLLPRIDVQTTLRNMFAELAAKKAVQPAQTTTLFPNSKGDVITYQGVLEKGNVFGAKLSPYIAGEAHATVTAWTCLMSMQTGQPILLCDSSMLTTERTAGTTALAVDLLSKRDSKVLTIIGSGEIAFAHWKHVEKLRDWSEVRLWSPQLRDNADKRQKWSNACPHIKFTDSAEIAAKDADVILLCTSSGKPVIDTVEISDGALVTSISTNIKHAHEVPPEFLNQSQVYCDYRETTPDSAGEMVIAKRDHNWNTDDLMGDLPELVSKQCAMPNRTSPVFFRSLGLGLEDIAIANEIYISHTNQQG